MRPLPYNSTIPSSLPWLFKPLEMSLMLLAVEIAQVICTSNKRKVTLQVTLTLFESHQQIIYWCTPLPPLELLQYLVLGYTCISIFFPKSQLDCLIPKSKSSTLFSKQILIELLKTIYCNLRLVTSTAAI